MAKESRFDRLAHHIYQKYKAKGYSDDEARRIADATAAKIGREKYGAKRMEEKAEERREALSND